MEEREKVDEVVGERERERERFSRREKKMRLWGEGERERESKMSDRLPAQPCRYHIV